MGLSSLFLKTLSSRGVYIRPSVMVAPPFVPECMTPSCLAHGNEGEATRTTTVGILPLSSTQGKEGEATPMTPKVNSFHTTSNDIEK